MNTTALVLTTLASAVIVLGGLAAVTRALWHVAQDLRDNQRATQANTTALGELRTVMDGRVAALERWRAVVERRRRPWQ